MPMTFEKAYVRTVSVSLIPTLVNPARAEYKNIHKKYRKKSINKLYDNFPRQLQLGDIWIARPAFDFKGALPKSKYEDYFLHPFWEYCKNVAGDYCSFPLKCKVNKNSLKFFSRTDDKVYSYVNGIFYQYGAFSIRLNDFINGEVSSDDIIQLTDNRVQNISISERVNLEIGKQMISANDLFRHMRERTLEGIHKKDPPKNPHTSWYKIISVGKFDNYDEEEFAKLIGFSKRPERYKKYLPSEISNWANPDTLKYPQEKDNQHIYFGEHCCLIHGKTLSKNALRCLRNRISYVAELYLIQRLFLRRYNILIRQWRTQGQWDLKVKWKKKKWFYKIMQETGNVAKIMELQLNLAKNDTWHSWYMAMNKYNEKELLAFIDTVSKIRDDFKDFKKEYKDKMDDIKETLTDVLPVPKTLINRITG